MDQFSLGDVVELKSGGPRMTIGRAIPSCVSDDRGRLECLWFEGSRKHIDEFPAETLIKVPVRDPEYAAAWNAE